MYQTRMVSEVIVTYAETRNGGISFIDLEERFQWRKTEAAQAFWASL
jgi:hypothetical protein